MEFLQCEIWKGLNCYNGHVRIPALLIVVVLIWFFLPNAFISFCSALKIVQHDQLDQTKENTSSKKDTKRQSISKDWIIIGNPTFNPQRHCFISAFYDLGRGSWNTKFNRSTQRYFSYFERFVRFPEPLVIFMDEKHVHDLVKLVKERRQDLLTIVIPINEAFLNEHIYCWALLSKEAEIMASTEYQKKIAHRITHPEHNNPRYTLINHAKIDFVILAIEELQSFFLPPAQKETWFVRYSWIDFGYLHEEHFIPKTLALDLSLLPTSTITYFIMSPMSEKFSDPNHILVTAPDLVTGGFFSGTKSVLYEFQDHYHQAIHHHQQMNIANDDQDIIPYIYYKQWSQFTFIEVPSYKHALLYLCDHQAN